MAKINRREFIKAGLTGMAGLSLAGSALAKMKLDLPHETGVNKASGAPADAVRLGATGLVVSRIAMGTGTIGGNKESNQTRLGMDKFVGMARHAYDRGVRFFDMADSYGSQPFVGEAIKTLPREKITLLSKLWTHPGGPDSGIWVQDNVDRIRKELGTDYVDILLMHCMMDGNWDENRKHYMDGYSKAKMNGLVKAVGVSCHDLQALRRAVENPWVDVIMARLNPFGTNMDADTATVNEILATAKKNGKGIVGMKIFGEGKHVSDQEREQSIRFAVTEGNIHAMTLGLESIAQVDDAVDRVMRNVNG